MTKVDEKAPVPPVDAAARARLAEALDRDERWSLRLEMIGAAEEALRTSEVDLAPLNEAPPLMRHRAIRDGVLLVERDHDERIRLETRAMLDFFDTQPLRDTLRAGLKRRIEEGLFGRR